MKTVCRLRPPRLPLLPLRSLANSLDPAKRNRSKVKAERFLLPGSSRRLCYRTVTERCAHRRMKTRAASAERLTQSAFRRSAVTWTSTVRSEIARAAMMA